MLMPVNRKAGRLGAIAGVAFVVLNLVGGVVHGSEPSLSASAAAITAYYRHHHSAIIGSLLVGGAIASVLLLVVALVLADRLRGAGRRLTGATVLATFTAGMAASVLSGAIEIGLAQTAAHTVNPSYVRGAYSAVVTLNTAPLLFLALGCLAIVLGGRGVLPGWFLGVNGVVSALTFLGGIAVGTSGFFASNDGGAVVFAGLALYAWALTAGWILWRMPQPETAEPMPDPATDT
jgi:hypothetical protein